MIGLNEGISLESQKKSDGRMDWTSGNSANIGGRVPKGERV
jgi:hypothetical protein